MWFNINKSSVVNNGYFKSSTCRPGNIGFKIDNIEKIEQLRIHLETEEGGGGISNTYLLGGALWFN